MPSATNPIPYIGDKLIQPRDYFSHRAESSPLIEERLSSRSSEGSALQRQHSIPRKAVGSPSLLSGQASRVRKQSIPRKEVGSPSCGASLTRRKSNESSVTTIHNPAVSSPLKQIPVVDNVPDAREALHHVQDVESNGPKDQIRVQEVPTNKRVTEPSTPVTSRRSSSQGVPIVPRTSQPGLVSSKEINQTGGASVPGVSPSHSRNRAPDLHPTPQHSPLNSQQPNGSPKTPTMTAMRSPSHRLESFLDKATRPEEYEDLQERRASAISYRSVSTKQVQIHPPSAQSQRNVSRQGKIITCLNELPPIALKAPFEARIPSNYPAKESYPVVRVSLSLSWGLVADK